MPAPPPAPLAVEIVSDLACPWCLIGLRRFEQALEQAFPAAASAPGAAGAAAPAVELHFRPFLLDPAVPPDGHDLRASLRRRYGDPEPMFRRVEAAARASGIPLDFARVRRWPDTVPAHTLIRHAAARGTQHALVRALYAAYFLDGLDVSDPSVLAAIGSRHGFDADTAAALVRDPGELAATRAEALALARGGLGAVPTFVIGGRVTLTGAQPVATFVAALGRARAAASGAAGAPAP